MNLSLQVIQRLRSLKQTLGFAESCTAGLASATLGEIAGVSDIFLGSVVSYSNEVKENLLQVSNGTLKTEGAVSEQVALQMAQGLRKQVKCHWSVSITGIAGPTGGTPEKPVGTVWFAVVGPGFETTEKKLFSGSRKEIQKQAVQFAFEILSKSLS
jgi:PncC family amidohydrolase